MKVYVNAVTGIDDALVSMYVSKRSLTREKEIEIRDICSISLDENGRLEKGLYDPTREKFEKMLNTLCKWGKKHITLLRFIDISVTVYGLHRAGQDDWDSHSKRFDNRIIRSSTRRKDSFSYEMSDYYKGKIIPTDLALKALGIDIPKEVTISGKEYVKYTNGYIQKDMGNNGDVQRGLYMLSIPSDFIFKINLTEWSHVYKMRNEHSGANPEVKELCESIADQLEKFHKQFNRDLFNEVEN